jgi:hypothetical protein
MLFRDRYAVVPSTWDAFTAEPTVDLALYIVDVTTVDTDGALTLLSRLLHPTRVIVCSLHQNEVQVYQVGHGAYTTESRLPDLFAIAA